MNATRWTRLATVIVAALLPLASAAQTLTVSAAASLTDVLRELGPRFEAARPGVSVRFNFAASGVLIRQIVQGAPVDVFVSADPQTVDEGVRLKVLDPATRRDVARNALVMVVPAKGGLPLADPADLAQPSVRRVAIGKPATVPAGRYAQQALTEAGVWPALATRAVYADSVRQVLDYVARGEVEAGFVYRTDAMRMHDRVRVVARLRGHPPIVYPAVVVADSPARVAAGLFIDYLTSPEAQAVLARHGFESPDPPGGGRPRPTAATAPPRP
jgi:molybdate transport system substrate-binding protein